jgi:hypothetical protein
MLLQPLFGFEFGDDCQHFHRILGDIVEHADVICGPKTTLRT